MEVIYVSKGYYCETSKSTENDSILLTGTINSWLSIMPLFFRCIQDIPLEQIVRISCMSARKLQTAFKEYHGRTITEYIQQRRMSQAETLLAKTDLSIGQVAQSVGYTSASRFAELFRKSTGLLPLEYRKVSQRK